MNNSDAMSYWKDGNNNKRYSPDKRAAKKKKQGHPDGIADLKESKLLSKRHGNKKNCNQKIASLNINNDDLTSDFNNLLECISDKNNNLINQLRGQYKQWMDHQTEISFSRKDNCLIKSTYFVLEVEEFLNALRINIQDHYKSILKGKNQRVSYSSVFSIVKITDPISENLSTLTSEQLAGLLKHSHIHKKPVVYTQKNGEKEQPTSRNRKRDCSHS